MILEFNHQMNQHKIKVLIASATLKEQQIAKQVLAQNSDKQLIELDFLVAGIGGAAATFALTHHASKADLIILTGIAGGFDDKVKIGDVVQVDTDCFGDLGVDDNGLFRSVFDIGLVKDNEFPFEKGRIVAENSISLPLKKVNGITVNTVSGSSAQIQKLRSAYPDVEIETMEGAYVHYVARQLKKPLLHLRGISNYVEPRNRNNWKIEESIEATNRILIDVVNNLSSF